MCLYSAKKITPEDDILVYKALRVRKRNENLLTIKEYCSPYHWDTVWYFRERKDIDASQPDLLPHVSPFGRDYYKIQGDAFHSFKDKERALEEAGYLEHMHDEPVGVYVVGEFIIPKDSRYVYEGVYCASVSYASSSLVFNGLCKTTTKD